MKNKKNRYYVYEWFNKETGEVFYVGKGCNNRYLQKSGRNQYFIDYYNEHECEVRKVFLNLTEKEAFDKEIELIAYYRKTSNFRLTNETDGGDGHPFKCGEENPKYGKGYLIKGKNNPFYGKKHTIKVREIISNNAKERIGEINPFFGKHHNYRTKKILSIKAKERLKMSENNPMYGKNHTEEARIKMSEAKKGKTLSEEHKNKVSEALKEKYKYEIHFNKGRKHSEEYSKKCRERSLGERNPNWGNGEKIKGEKNPMYGKKHSEETRRKMRERAKSKVFNCKCKICGEDFKGRSWNASKCGKCKIDK